MTRHVLTGFGFGPIQSGLFLAEAFAAGSFDRLVVAEIDEQLVQAVRANGGRYSVNVAHADRVEVVEIDGVEMLNPHVPSDRQALLAALAESTEITTCLPAVGIYQAGGDGSVGALLAQGLQNKRTEATIVYAAENNNHAAEILAETVANNTSAPPTGVQYVNTVIGKMSQVVTDPARVECMGLKTITPGFERAFLVEAFNHILATRCQLPNFLPGIEVFVEKEDLLPFEEAKLYGHNAIHALLAYLGTLGGYRQMTELKNDEKIMAIARTAFLNESGAALVKKYAHLNDELFTKLGYQHYADDLLERITNPFLEDSIARAGRDPVRKLASNDRIFGTMALALDQGTKPDNMALGAAAGLATLLAEPEEDHIPRGLQFGSWEKLTPAQIEKLLRWLWEGQTCEHAQVMIELVQQAHKQLTQ